MSGTKYQIKVEALPIVEGREHDGYCNGCGSFSSPAGVVMYNLNFQTGSFLSQKRLCWNCLKTLHEEVNRWMGSVPVEIWMLNPDAAGTSELTVTTGDALLHRAYQSHKNHPGAFLGGNFVECPNCLFHVHLDSQTGDSLWKHWTGAVDPEPILSLDDPRIN